MKPEDKKQLEEIRKTLSRGNYWNPYPDFLLRLVDEGQENYLFMCAEYDKAEAQLNERNEQLTKAEEVIIYYKDHNDEGEKAREYLEGE